MTIGIYCIRHVESGKRYIGKSIDIERRWTAHRNAPDNRHLARALAKYGLASFSFEILEAFSEVNEAHLADREMHWIEHFNSHRRAHGYNLRRDSSSRSVFHEETKTRMASARRARWDDDEYRAKTIGLMTSPEYRAKVSQGLKAALASPSARALKSAAAQAAWSNPSYRSRMAFARLNRAMRQAFYLWILAP
ncbi:hypothetical protein EN759_04135 [Mesorhizobium sp. M00.F.Ca.ET.038.03.1.1]|nr:hypothetical protein EN759_04135 [Mesorhizobium sp. M00.F.Ca.ET.038.03.1.1]TIW04390.1 MAG: hypothetical protein E5V77_00715 [Mesorhizobium sp.]